MSIRKGRDTSISRKIKINTSSSTQSEIVGVYYCSPQVMWESISFRTKNSMTIPTSSIRITRVPYYWRKNGRASRSNRTKQINIRYFLIQDRVENGEVTVVHCPTD